MAERVKRHYVNNRDFYDAIVVFHEKLAENPNERISDYIGKCILAICNKLSTKPNFIGYSFREEMVADAVENCISSVVGFNPTRSTNPFAYFTQIAWNAFLRRISKEKKQQYIKHKNMVNTIAISNLNGEFVSSVGGTESQYNEASNEIIDSYENKLTKSKKSSIVGIEKFSEEILDEHREDEFDTEECH